MAVQREKRRTDSLNELPRPLKINSPMTRVLHSAWNPSSPQIPPLYFSSHPPPTSPSGNFPRTVGVFFPLRQVGLNFQGFLNSLLGKSCFWPVSQDFLNSFLVTSFCWEVTWVAFCHNVPQSLEVENPSFRCLLTRCWRDLLLFTPQICRHSPLAMY